ncbi:GtrA family protein [Candidatus Kaiserbacteria bacterium]|nr:GtrA family protein [Candidatus Kaiserbacteria bacterium]MCB9811328.1 GtrA family protein [Candidatus Nomurabacteria bacterium]
MQKTIERFIKYTFVGTATFALDLLLLVFLTDYFKVPYLPAAGVSFLIAVSLNYVLSRRYVFRGSLRSTGSGYLNFLSIAVLGLLIVLAGMYVLVSLLGLPLLPSRLIVAAVTGFWNYLLNLFVNFKVAGKH